MTTCRVCTKCIRDNVSPKYAKLVLHCYMNTENIIEMILVSSYFIPCL